MIRRRDGVRATKKQKKKQKQVTAMARFTRQCIPPEMGRPQMGRRHHCKFDNLNHHCLHKCKVFLFKFTK